MTTDESLEVLAELLSPRVSTTPSADWSRVRARLHAPAPADYRAFIDRFGGGTIDGFLHVFHPSAHRSGFRLLDDGHLDDLRDFGTGELHFPLWPEPGGLLPCARTLDGDHVYWLTEGQPDEWRIVLTESLYDWWEYDGSLTRFLATVLGGEVSYPIFPDEWPLRRYSWEPFHTE